MTVAPQDRSTGLINLTYISQCAAPADTTAQTLAILDQAQVANRGTGITGALLFSGDRFVQTLEGPRAAVEALMQRIEHDPRHVVIAVIDRHGVEARNFANWSMAYVGPSYFVSKAVTRALAAAEHGPRQDIDRLLQLLIAFTEPLPPRPKRGPA